MTTSKDEMLVEVLLKDYERATQELISTQQRGEAALALGPAALGAVLLYGTGNGPAEVVYAAPFAMIGILIYITRVYTVVMALGGYRMCLEKRIGKAIDHPYAMVWEKNVSKPVLNDSAAARIVEFTLATVPLLISIIAYVKIWKDHAWRGIALFTVPFVLALVLLVIENRDRKAAGPRSYRKGGCGDE